MKLIGASAAWANLIDTLVPEILELVIATWDAMPSSVRSVREDPTTEALCRLLRQNRNSGNFPFRIDIQMVELDPSAGEDQGRLDIAFSPPINREDIYFCLECKRLNVVLGRRCRTHATEYVIYGMSRFVRGQYSAMVRHGGMLGYVLNGNVNQAVQSVSDAIQARHVDLGMQPPGEIQPSSIRPSDERFRETQHVRQGSADPFQIHHIFVPSTVANLKQRRKSKTQCSVKES
jgi:hypothetical protein